MLSSNQEAGWKESTLDSSVQRAMISKSCGSFSYNAVPKGFLLAVVPNKPYLFNIFPMSWTLSILTQACIVSDGSSWVFVLINSWLSPGCYSLTWITESINRIFYLNYQSIHFLNTTQWCLCSYHDRLILKVRHAAENILTKQQRFFCFANSQDC